MPDRISATGSVTAGSSATGEIETANGLAREEERAMQAQRLSGVLGRPGAAPVKKGLTFPECGFHLESRAEPSRAEPSRAEPSRAEPSRAEPSRAEPSRAEPSPSRAEPPDRLPSPRGGHPSPSTASAAGRPAGFARLAGGRRGLVHSVRTLAAVALLALVGGLALPATTQAQAPGVLVSNMGQASGGRGNNINDTWLAAQGFSVPSGGGNYTLTSIEILVSQDISSTNIGSLSVSVWSADSSGRPDSSLHTLTNPASVTADVAASFTAPASATLEAGNTYVVLVDYDLTGEPLAELRVRVGFSFSVSSAGQALGLIGGHWGRFLILLSCQTTESGGTTPMALREILSSYWSCFQALLFPQLEETIGALGERHQRFVMVLEWVRVETLLPYQHRRRGCPPSDRAALARAFIAKAVFALVSTRMLLDRLRHDSTLRRLCGWRSVKHIPSEATFSRAFAEFADSALPSHLHEALIKRTQGERLAGHISRDSTAIEGRERPTPKAPQPAKPKRRRGRPRKGEERQRNMTLPEMLADLPYACDIGVKRDAKGYQTSWSGYKLHIDAADGAIPVSCLLTSASLHDSQVAIPLATLTAERVRNLYDLMDSAYDAPEIRAHSRALGHVAIIDVNPRSGARKQALRQERQARRACGLVLSEERRYHERSTVERVNGRLKDEFGGRSVRVRGHAKVLCHLMFGIVALTVDQLMRLVT